MFKRFVSQIIDKLCNYLFYLAMFNTSCMRSKIRFDMKSCKILEFCRELNKALVVKQRNEKPQKFCRLGVWIAGFYDIRVI